MRRDRFRTGKVASLLLMILVTAVLLGWMVMFKVDFTEYALVQTFGKTTRVLDGADDAGLHFKWPFVQSVTKYDARTFVFEDTYTEAETTEKHNVIITTFCAWRIADPVKFSTTIKTVEAGREGIRSKLSSAKDSVIRQHKMADLVNTDPGAMRIAEIEQAILDQVSAEAREDYGAEVLLVGVKTLGLSEQVSSAVIDAMKAKQQTEAGTYETEGKAQATAIREWAREASQQILAFADRKATEIRAEGEKTAEESYKEYGEDWQLAAYLHTLESLRKQLKGKTVYLLDGSMIPGIEYLRKGPSLPSGRGPWMDKSAAESALKDSQPTDATDSAPAPSGQEGSR